MVLICPSLENLQLMVWKICWDFRDADRMREKQLMKQGGGDGNTSGGEKK